MEEIEVSIVMPCLNEEATIGTCIEKAREGLKQAKVTGEIIVVDNGSTDKSVEIAKSSGARVIYEPKKGYGNAYKTGMKEARGKYIIIGDSDDTYDFLEISSFLKELKEGADFVIGTRLRGKILPKAMPWLHRYFGTPFLAWLLNLFFNTGISDPNCGMRGLTKEAFEKMDLQSGGMEFASEMIISAARKKLAIKEVPITYYPRKGESKLRTFHDGWRHLRFMLFYSPTYLFLWPGLLITLTGLFFLFALLPGPLKVGRMTFDIHYMVFGGTLAILGSWILILGLMAKTYAYVEDYEVQDRLTSFFLKIFTLERGISLGSVLFLIGLGIGFYIFLKWAASGFGALAEVRSGLLALTLTVIGTQIFFSSFFISILLLKKGRF